MSARTGLALLLTAVGASVAAQVAPGQQSQPSQPPTFRAGVEYVEVDARVVDSRNEPVHGLSQRDFQVFEDGVKQDVVTFSAVDIPLPSPPDRQAGRTRSTETTRPDVATNRRQRLDGRIYLIAVDDLFIDPARTTFVRRFLADFIDRSLGPDDQAAVVSLGRSVSFQNFTSDKTLLTSAVERIDGAKVPSPVIQTLAFDLGRRSGLAAGGGSSPDAPVALGKTVDARSTQRSLVRLIRALSGIEARSKAIIFVSEETPFEMVSDEEGLWTEGRSLINDLQASSDLARRSSVPIYPVDPRALTGLHEETILVPIVGLTDTPAETLQKELSASQQRLRGLADDTGGFAVVGVNDLIGGLDRIVRQSSSYYVLGYYSKNPKHDGKYRKIEVKVDRRDVGVLARHGYMAQSAKASKPASLPGPPGSPEPVRAALNSVLPVAGMTLSTTGAAFREARGRTATVAVVLEGAGSDLALIERNGALSGQLDLMAVALQPRGDIAATDMTHLQLTLPAQTADRIRRNGFRWLARLNNLKPGRYQLRAVAASTADMLGSVWYELVVPDFSDGPLTMSDLLIASVSGLEVPTFKPDKAMQDMLRGPATTNRRFVSGDGIVVFAEVYDNRLDNPHDIDTTVVVKNDRGIEVFRSGDTQSSRELAGSQGVLRSRTPIALKEFQPGRYIVTVDAYQRQDPAAHVTRTVPIEVVGNAGR